MGQGRKLLCCTEQRELKFLGHATRQGELENLARSCRISGKRARGAQRFTYINIFKRLYKNPGQLWETARNRTRRENIIWRAGSVMKPNGRNVNLRRSTMGVETAVKHSISIGREMCIGMEMCIGREMWCIRTCLLNSESVCKSSQQNFQIEKQCCWFEQSNFPPESENIAEFAKRTKNTNVTEEHSILLIANETWQSSCDYEQGRHQQGASGASPLHLKSVPPHFTFDPLVAAYI